MKFFAEGLPRVGVVNLQVQLDTPSTDPVSIFTTEEGVNVVLQHDGELNVPISLPASSTKILKIQSKKSIITARIPTTCSSNNDEPLTLLSAEEIQTQWSQGAMLSCSACHRKILTSPQMRWKDLPSDSWVEFSDYWLCHSGNSHSHSQSHPHTSAPVLPTLRTTPGTGLVGLTSLLIHPDNSDNIIIKSSDVVCECGVRLGEVIDGGLRLDLWRVCICAEKCATECLVCYMIHHVAQSATHKFALVPKAGEGILIWVFSTDVMITSSAYPSPRKVIKVMFRDTKSTIEDIEKLRLDDDVVTHVRLELQRMGAQIVEITRMGDWDVGYLPRN